MLELINCRVFFKLQPSLPHAAC